MPGYCYCSYDDGLYPYVEKYHRAAKPHECCDCGETIEIGEFFLHWMGIYEGEGFSGCVCEFCMRQRTELAELVGIDEECIPWGRVNDAWKEAWARPEPEPEPEPDPPGKIWAVPVEGEEAPHTRAAAPGGRP